MAVCIYIRPKQGIRVDIRHSPKDWRGYVRILIGHLLLFLYII